MNDLEKAIKGLECCITMPDIYPHCEECPYADEDGMCVDMNELHKDALALLKAQEAVEPKIIDTSNSKLYHNDMFKNHYCGNCGEFLHVVNRRDMFCSQCGRKVKWE